MRKLLWLLLLFALPAFGQSPVIGSGVQYVPTAPSGSCAQAPPVQVLNSSGAIYTCDNGTWAMQGGSGGGATSVSNSDGTLTVSPTTGAVIAGIALGHVNAWTGAQAFPTGSTGFTQNAGDISADLATDLFVHSSQVSYNPTSYIAYGDSITVGSFVTNLNNAYPNRIGAFLNIPQGAVTNRAVSGAMAADVLSLQVLPNDAPAETAQQPLRTELISTNEANSKGAGPYEATFNTIYQATLAWESIAAPNKVMGSTVVGSTTGTCAQDNTYAAALGVVCTSNGAIAPFSITTTGGPIYIWYRAIDSDAGTFTYAVDGGSTVAVTTALTTAIATINGTTSSVALIRVPVSSGSHTISFVKTDAGGNMGIIGVGTPSNLLFASQPYIIVGDTPSQLNGNDASAVAAYRADIDADVALLQGDGLNIQLKYISQYLLATTAAGDMGNTLHPNDTGHGEMAAAFMAGSNLWNGRGAATPYFGAYSGNQTTGPGTQVIAMNGSTLTLSTQPMGTQYLLINESATSTTIAAGSGATVVPTTSIPQDSMALAVAITNSTWLIQPISGSAPTYYNGIINVSYSIATGNSQVIPFNCSAVCTLTLPTPLNGQVVQVVNRNATYAVTLSGSISSGPTSVPPLGSQTLVGSASAWWTLSTQSIASKGVATLTSGTVTVSSTAACAAATGCVYKLDNCGPNASAGIGVLSLGTVTAGTSFVINSLSPAAAVLTTDASTVCWQIN